MRSLELSRDVESNKKALFDEIGEVMRSPRRRYAKPLFLAWKVIQN